MNRIAIGIISTFFALFLAWRVGEWLWPETQTPLPAATGPTEAGRGKLFLSGKVPEGPAYELRDVKVEGKAVAGVVVVRFDTPRTDLKPLALAALEDLKRKVPGAERADLAVKPYAGCPGCGIGRIEWRNGKVRLFYGTPVQAQMDASNALIGTKGEDDPPRLFVPDNETFGAGIGIVLAIEEERKKNPALPEEKLLEKGAAAAGVPYVAAKRSRDYMQWYFTGDRYGSVEFPFQGS